VPHRLYGHVPASERYSVGAWLADISAVLADARAGQRRPIIVGGTGLYFRALTKGLAPVPAIPAEIREGWRDRAEAVSVLDLHRLLRERSTSEAERVRPSDRTRILRALEVLDATGRTLPDWQSANAAPLLPPDTADRIVLTLDRGELRRRIDRRLLAMIEAGALDEARHLAMLGLDPALPVMKAAGLRPLLDHLAGRPGLEVITAAETETRQYAKRQETWFRNQMPDWPRRSPPL
jgi:tRNA dimethylallyltransferase